MYGYPQQPAFMPMQPATGGSNALARDLTSLDLDMGPVASRGAGGLNVSFFYARVRIENEADPTLHGTYQTRLCVAKQPKGDRLTIAQHFITEDQAMRLFPAEFSNFKQYESAPTNGTPLFELPGISQAQIALLTLNGLRCVEDVVDCAQEQINTMGPDVVMAHRTAKRWLEAKTAAAPILDAAARDVEMEKMRAQIAMLINQNQAQAAQLEIVARMQPMMQAPAGQAGQVVAAGPATMGGQGQNVGIVELGSAEGPLPESALFEGGVVTDNNDLNLDADPVSLPGLDRPRGRGRN